MTPGASEALQALSELCSRARPARAGKGCPRTFFFLWVFFCFVLFTSRAHIVLKFDPQTESSLFVRWWQWGPVNLVNLLQMVESGQQLRWHLHVPSVFWFYTLPLAALTSGYILINTLFSFFTVGSAIGFERAQYITQSDLDLELFSSFKCWDWCVPHSDSRFLNGVLLYKYHRMHLHRLSWP